jgi:hypothetical protein
MSIFSNQKCLAEINSSKKEALAFLDKIDQTKESGIWPNVKPRLFYDNLKLNLERPMSFLPGPKYKFLCLRRSLLFNNGKRSTGLCEVHE